MQKQKISLHLETHNTNSQTTILQSSQEGPLAVNSLVSLQNYYISGTGQTVKGQDAIARLRRP